MKFTAPEEVLDFLTSNIRTGYKERYSSVTILDEGVSYKKIRFELCLYLQKQKLLSLVVVFMV